MDIWTSKKRTLQRIDAMASVICLVASLVVFFTVLYPLIRQHSFLADQRNKLTAHLDECSALSVSMRTLGNQLATVQEELGESMIRLGSSDQTNRRLAALTSLFNDCSLAVDDIQAGTISAGHTWDSVPISIAGRGEYTQFIAVLHRIRQRFADMSVIRFRLEGDPARAEGSKEFRFQLLWHTAPKTNAIQN